MNTALTFPGAYEDYPFAEIPGEDHTTVMRHSADKKSFAFIMRHNGRLYLNLKCDPLEAGFLRQAFTGILPGYHMSHTHWNTIVIGSDVPEEEIKRQIGNRYILVKPKAKRRTAVSKYEPLWKHLQADGRDTFLMTYDAIQAVLGFDIDHSFLNAKKEAAQFGYAVGKISMKEKHVTFDKM